MRWTNLFPLLVVAALFAAPALAEDSIPPLATEVTTVEGRLTLTVSGTAPDTENWLGVSFYLPDYTDWIWEGDHAVYLVPQGEFEKSYPVPEGFEEGTYEVALWQDLAEKKTLYRMDTIRAYGYGSVKETGE